MRHVVLFLEAVKLNTRMELEIWLGHENLARSQSLSRRLVGVLQIKFIELRISDAPSD